MGRLIYSAIASLDGYVEDASGNFDWAAPDDELHAFFNDLERPVGTYLYGRRMYETMSYWEAPPDPARQPPVVRDFAEIWQAADKIVFSRTLERVSTAKTRLEQEFKPETVRDLKRSSGPDLTIGGPVLAAQALDAGLVDELAAVFVPILVGGGHHWLRAANARLDLELLDERSFGSGAVYARYAVR